MGCAPIQPARRVTEMSEIYGKTRNYIAQLFSRRFAIRRPRTRRELKEAREELFALHDFTPAPEHRDQLTFVAGDEFLLKSDADQRWWHCKHCRTGKKGYVPRSYVTKKREKVDMEWCHLTTTRDDTDRRLMRDDCVIGSFIIRPKEGKHYSEALVLALKARIGNEVKINHYVINRKDGDFRIGDNSFPTLALLVQYYAGHNSRLPQPLKFSVKKNCEIEVWEINEEEIELGEKLGSGNFGEVFKAVYQGQLVAVKTVFQNRLNTKEFMREAEIARACFHKHIVKTIGVCSAKPYIVTEYLPGKSLKEYLTVHRPSIRSDDLLPIAQKIACAMAHLELKEYVHRDLAARNILVGATLETIKLADFGMARRVADSEYYRPHGNNVMCPWKWTAPEAIRGSDGQQHGCSTTKSDVWSFGILLWEIYSKGEEPYKDMNYNQMLHMLREEDFRLRTPTECPPVIYAKMLECWDLEPANRPTFADLHSFLLDPYGAVVQPPPPQFFDI